MILINFQKWRLLSKSYLQSHVTKVLFSLKIFPEDLCLPFKLDLDTDSCQRFRKIY